MSGKLSRALEALPAPVEIPDGFTTEEGIQERKNEKKILILGTVPAYTGGPGERSEIVIDCTVRNIEETLEYLRNKYDRMESYRIVELLRERRGHISPLHVLAQRGNIDCLSWYIEKYREHLPEEFNIDEPTRDENNPVTALHLGIYKCNIGVVDFLLRNGANFEITTCANINIMHLCASVGNIELFETIKRFFSDTDSSETFKKLCVAKNMNGDTPLLVAVWNANIEMAEKLLECAPDTLSEPNYIHATPLHYAASIGSREIDPEKREMLIGKNYQMVRLLVSRGAEMDYGNRKKDTPLLVAADTRARKSVRYMLLRGANRNLCRVNGSLPLFLSAKYADLDTMYEILLREPCAPEMIEEEMTKPFYSESRELQVSFPLERIRTNINYVNNDNETALMCALCGRNTEKPTLEERVAAAKMILKCKPDTSVISSFGVTALCLSLSSTRSLPIFIDLMRDNFDSGSRTLINILGKDENRENFPVRGAAGLVKISRKMTDIIHYLLDILEEPEEEISCSDKQKWLETFIGFVGANSNLIADVAKHTKFMCLIAKRGKLEKIPDVLRMMIAEFIAKPSEKSREIREKMDESYGPAAGGGGAS